MKRLIALLAAVALFQGCGRKPAEAPREKLTLAVARLPHNGVLHVAIARGEFAKEGLDLTVQYHAFGKVALESMLNGKADLATCAETPFVLAILRQADVTAIASIATSEMDVQVIARKEAGVVAPRDLAGKRIGVTAGTNGEFFLDSLLIRHQVPKASIRVVNLEPAAMPSALATGLVDAVATWNPNCVKLKEQWGDRAVAFTAGDIYQETNVLVGRGPFIASHRTVIEKVLRALVRTEGFMRKQPQQARRLVYQVLADDPAELDKYWDLFDFKIRLDQSLLLLLAEEARWAIRTGAVPKQAVPNFLSNVSPEPLVAVEPRAVSLIR